MKLNRRKFIAQSSLVMGLPVLTMAHKPNRFTDLQAKFKTGDTILFQGDSITDAGREKRNNFRIMPLLLEQAMLF